MPRFLPAMLVAGALLPGLARADVLLHDRSSDPAGAAQGSPSVAVTYNQSAGASYLVTAWQQQVGAVREFNVSLAQVPLGSGPVSDLNVPPAPAGYIWFFDPRVGAPTVTTDGTFFLFGQIRSSGSSPFTYGLGFVRGKAQAGATVSWETPQVLETFGTNTLNQGYIDALAMDVHPGTNVVHIGYINTKPDFALPGKSLWHRTSPNGGVTWNAPAMVGNDSSSSSGISVRCGRDSGQVTLFFATENGLSRTLHCRRSTDFGVTLGPTEDVRTFTTTFQSAPFGVSGPLLLATEIDRTGAQGLAPQLFAIASEEIDHAAYTFPNPATAPAQVEVEPNGNAALATLVPSSGVVLRGAIAAAADTDWYAFDLAAGDVVDLLADSTSGTLSFPRCTWFGPDGRSILTRGAINGLASRLGFAAPAAARYYLTVANTGSGIGSYRVRTVGGTVSSGARDAHDLFLSSTEPQQPWNPALNVSAAAGLAVGLDEGAPSLCSNLDGYLYGIWTQWDAGTVTSRRIARRSANGGVTWQSPVELDATPSNWLNALVPTNAVTVTSGPWASTVTDGRDIHDAWVDARNGDADLYGTTIPRRLVVTGTSPSALTVTPGQAVDVDVTTQNLDPYFGWDARLDGSSSRGWLMPSFAGTLAPGQTAALHYGLGVPDTAAYGTVTVTFTVKSNQVPYTAYDHGLLTLTIGPPAGVGEGVPVLAMAPVAPNPAVRQARIGFSLSRAGHARASVFAIDGRRVRTLVDSELPAGTHARFWDGRDDSGNAVAAGAYMVRLEAEGRALQRRLVWLR